RLDAGGAPASWRGQLHPRGDGPDAFQVTIRNYMSSVGARLWDRPAEPNDHRCPEADALPAFITHQNVRLFRRCPELAFVGRVHESVGPRVAAAGLRLGESRGCIHHFGLALEGERQAGKNRYYRELGRRKAAERPGDAQAHFELGLTEFENFHQDGEALACFERCLRLQPGFTLAWVYGGAALLRMGHPAEALGFLGEAAQQGHASAWLLEMQGDAGYNLGQFAAAAACYRAAARAQTGRGDDSGLQSKQGLSLLRAGDRGEGFRLLRAARERNPQRADNHDRLVAACVWAGDREGAREAQRTRLGLFPGAAASRRLEALESFPEEAAAPIQVLQEARR